MALAILKNEVDSLREEQNQKLLANHFFISERGDYYTDVWYFSGKNKITKIDFSVFDLSIFSLDSSATIHNNGNESELNSKEYAKLLCSVVLTHRSYQAVQTTYQMLMHIFAFLKENDEIVLDASLLERFWTSFMARTVDKNGFSNRISTPSYLGKIRPVALPKLRNQLLAFGVKGVIDQKLTQKKIENSLDKVCQSQYSVTLNEFKKSGSFNFLGLELGQYYVDYLNHVYQTNFFYTLICKKAISTMLSTLNKDIIENQSLRGRLTNVIFRAILGEESGKSRISTNDLARRV